MNDTERAARIEQIRAKRAALGSAHPLNRLRNHVTGAIERGEGPAITSEPVSYVIRLKQWGTPEEVLRGFSSYDIAASRLATLSGYETTSYAYIDTEPV